MVVTKRRLAVALIAVAAVGCAPPDPKPAPTTDPPSAADVTPPPQTPAPPSDLTAAMREWEAVAGENFTRSARALRKVTESTDTGDEAGVRNGCQELHDANAVDLQADLPTPDPELTAELQRMIDDMNVATHACLRFVLARNPADATVYQDYLARAVDHLDRAKVILEEDRRPR